MIIIFSIGYIVTCGNLHAALITLTALFDAVNFKYGKRQEKSNTITDQVS